MHLHLPKYDTAVYDRMADGILRFKEPVDKNGTYLYDFEDIAFVNTSQFNEAARHFIKHGCYTKAPKGSREYKEYWDQEEHRRIHGMSAPGRLIINDKGEHSIQNVPITGEHYGYLNYAQIRRTVDPKQSKFEKRNFSETSGEPVIKDLGKARTKEVSFPDFWDGDFYYFTAKEVAEGQGLNLGVGKKRRGGYSYKNAWIVANRADLYPKSVNLLGAYDSAYLYPEGTMKMVDTYLQQLSKYTDWKKRRLYSREDYIKLGYKLLSSPDIERGFLSQVLAVSFGPNRPGAARGKDATLILLEEAGKFLNLLESLASTQPTIEDGLYVVGMIIAFGTGGGKDANWEDFEKLFYSPSLFKFMGFNNRWDEELVGTECGLFLPQYMCMPGFIDKDGNSLKIEAKEHEDKVRERIKVKSKSSSDIDDYVMERPFNGSEAFKRSGSNIFPVTELRQQELRVMKDPKIANFGRVGKLYTHPEKGVELDMTAEVRLIKNYPLKPDDDPTGGYIEWIPPHKINGKVPANLYRIWHDTFAVDKDKEKITIKDSLGAAYVYERPNNFTATKGDRIVACLVGRTERVDDYNEQLFKIAKRYNTAEGLMFENDRGDVIPYAKRFGYLDYLAPEPEITWKKEVQGKTGRNWGIHMNTPRIDTAIVYLRDWLIQKRGYDENGNEVLNLHYIYDIPFLQELQKFTPKGNFDRVSAFLVGMFDYKEQLMTDVMPTDIGHERQSDPYFDN